MSEHPQEKQPPGYRGTTGRLAGPNRTPAEQARLQRSRQNRQIFSGAEIRPISRGLSSYRAPTAALTQPQQMYAAALGALAVLGILLWLIFGMGVASIIFFLLALGLLGGWLAF
jgi:hypothetical protein